VFDDIEVVLMKDPADCKMAGFFVKIL